MNVLHLPIERKLGIDVKEDRHVDGLPRPQSLVLEAEALDLVEVVPRLIGRHVVRRDAGDGTFVRCDS